MSRTLLRSGTLALATIVLLAPWAVGQEKKPTFDAAADARGVLADATHLAAKKHRRVLVLWGREGRAGDLDLHQALRRGKTEDWPFYYEFVLSPLDCGAQNEELAKSLGAPPAADGPVLTVLDERGQPIAHQSAAEFRGDEGWDAAKIGTFLREHIVEAQDAEVVLDEALARAKQQDKRLFVHLGAPW